jgi:hypothetical protein
VIEMIEKIKDVYAISKEDLAYKQNEIIDKLNSLEEKKENKVCKGKLNCKNFNINKSDCNDEFGLCFDFEPKSPEPETKCLYFTGKDCIATEKEFYAQKCKDPNCDYVKESEPEREKEKCKDCKYSDEGVCYSEECIKEKPKLEFKVGDTVKILNDCFGDKNKVGKIENICNISNLPIRVLNKHYKINDIKPVEIKKVKGWVNIYKEYNKYTRVSDIYKNKKDADKDANSDRIVCVEIEIPYYIGQGIKED